MFKDFSILIIGLSVLVFAADQFLNGAARLAERFKVPKALVGALLVGFGTSAPELAASLTAVFQQEVGGVELAVGNIVGSNVANLGLVLAIPVLIWGNVIPPHGTREQAGYSFIGSLFFAAVVYFNLNSALGGIGLFAIFLITNFLILRFFKKSGVFPQSPPRQHTWPLSRELIVMIIGLVLTVSSPRWIVSSAVSIGNEFGWEGGFIGFSLIAIGTSLPELVTSLVGARRGEWGLIIGNLFGSNLFNSLGVGSAIMLSHAGLDRPTEQPFMDGSVLVGMCFLCLFAYWMMRRPVAISKWNSFPLLSIYAILFLQMVRTLSG
ncbi:MAG: sodium:calcium antiporter [Actinomycetota bacterium]|nr:sodium:calcium antiporter [Acidimicrobiales bacterium]MEC7898633.1 sodium:calcium antiporter [Actinomycetota bacterium]